MQLEVSKGPVYPMHLHMHAYTTSRVYVL